MVIWTFIACARMQDEACMQHGCFNGLSTPLQRVNQDTHKLGRMAAQELGETGFPVKAL